MNLPTLIAFLLVLAVLVLALRPFLAHFKGEGSCCGGGGKPAKAKRKKLARPTGQLTLKIGGMRCDHCRVRVQNALNSLDGVAASVRLTDGRATVRFSHPVTDDELTGVVEGVGYTVTEIRR